MPSSTTFSPRILIILAIPVILLIALVSALYFIPQPIPNQMDIKVQTSKGNYIESTSFKGKTLVVEFGATWCDFCQLTFSNINKVLMTNNYPNVVFLSVSIDPTHDTPTVLTNFIKANNYTQYAINSSQWIFSRDMSEQYTNYNVATIPHSFLVNTKSQIIANHLGELTYNNIVSWLSGNYAISNSPTMSTTNMTSTTSMMNTSTMMP